MNKKEFKDFTWEEISSLIKNLDQIIFSWKIGSEKELVLKDGSIVSVRIISNNYHDLYSNGEKAPLTFDFSKILFGVKLENNKEKNNLDFPELNEILKLKSSLLVKLLPEDFLEVVKPCLRGYLTKENRKNLEGDDHFSKWNFESFKNMTSEKAKELACKTFLNPFKIDYQIFSFFVPDLEEYLGNFEDSFPSDISLPMEENFLANQNPAKQYLLYKECPESLIKESLIDSGCGAYWTSSAPFDFDYKIFYDNCGIFNGALIEMPIWQTAGISPCFII